VEALAREIESASLRAWPSLEEDALEGWMLRFSDGFTKRANSVQPQGPSAGPFAGRVDHCEAWYDARGRPCIFRLTPYSEGGLDEYLAERGYELIDRTDVLQRDLVDLQAVDSRFELRAVSLTEWLEVFARLNAVEPAPALGRIIESVQPKTLLGVLCAGESARPVGCGMAVLEAPLLGLFDLVVGREERGRGYGGELVRRLAFWGSQGGASHAYLQVTQDNRSAAALYGKLRFRRAYEYWYRIRRANG
jgi:GNAT superfamily N-acetyltransferase